MTLPLGFELRFDAANARFFFVDHAKRATTWQDPRNDPPDVAISNEATEAALRQLELVSSGVLPEQAARPADFREALGHALRAALHADDVGEAAAALGPTHVRRLQQQQQIHLALIERLRDPPRPTATLQEAWAANAKRHAWAPAAPLDAHYYDSLRKHVDAHDLLEMYTSGFFGPKMSRLYRVRDRLDSLGVAMLRAPLDVGGVRGASPRRLLLLRGRAMASTLEGSSRPPRPLQPDALGSHAAVVARAADAALARPGHRVAAPILVAARHLLGAPPDARGMGSGAAEGTGAAAGADAAPGMGYRLARLYHVLLDKGLGGGGGGVAAGDERRLSGSGEAAAGSDDDLRAHLAVARADGLREWRRGLGLGEPPRLPEAETAELSQGRPRRRSERGIPPPPTELTTALSPAGAGAALVAALAGAAAPLETLLLRAPPGTPPALRTAADVRLLGTRLHRMVDAPDEGELHSPQYEGDAGLRKEAARCIAVPFALELAPHTVGALVRLLKHLLPAGASGTLPAAGPALQAAAAALRYLTLHLLALRSAGLDLKAATRRAKWLGAS